MANWNKQKLVQGVWQDGVWALDSSLVFPVNSNKGTCYRKMYRITGVNKNYTDGLARWRLGPGFLSCCFLQILIKEPTTERCIYGQHQ
jgi:hypothetical protein